MRRYQIRYDHDRSRVTVRCTRCRYVQRGDVICCLVCCSGLAEYLADFLYPETATALQRSLQGTLS